MHKCLIFNTEKDYVRTKNFVKYTKDLFEHEFVSPKSRLHKILSLKRNCWAYMPNFDPILLRMCNLLNVKVISDILEPHPEMHSSFILKKFYGLLEKDSVKRSNIVLTVAEEETANLKKKYNAKNIFTIRNFPELFDFKPSKRKFRRFIIIYFGVYAPSRNLKNVTKAIAKLQKEHEIDFLVIGDKRLLSQVHCNHRYFGWLNHNKASNLIGKSHIGICPYENSLHCNLTLQNKAFQYAACNTFPLSTSLKPLRNYKKLIGLVKDNSIENWYGEIKTVYFSWKNKKLKFNQREILIENKWVAKDEWSKLNEIIGKRK